MFEKNPETPDNNNTPAEETEDKPKMSVAEAFAKWFEKNLKSRGNTVDEFFAPEEDEDEDTTPTETKEA